MEILTRRLKHHPAKVETVREFLKEFGRIGQEARPEFSLAEFKPFLESMRDTARAAMRAERAQALVDAGGSRMKIREINAAYDAACK